MPGPLCSTTTVKTWFLTVGALATGAGGFLATRAAGADAQQVDPARVVAVFDCPDTGGGAIGAALGGDRVWVTGRSGGWALIRLTDGSGRPAWIPLSELDVDGTRADVAALPVIDCTPPEQWGGAPTVSTDPVATSPGTSAPSVNTTIATESSASPTTGPDTQAPTLSVNPNRSSFHGANGDPACPDLLTVAVTATDNRGSATVTGVVARWTFNGGPVQQPLAPAGSGTWTLQVFSQVPVPQGTVTITATATDPAGNVGTGSAQVLLLDPGSNGCVG